MQTLKGNERGWKVREGDVMKRPKVTSTTKESVRWVVRKRERMECGKDREDDCKTKERVFLPKTLKTETFAC